MLAKKLCAGGLVHVCPRLGPIQQNRYEAQVENHCNNSALSIPCLGFVEVEST